MKRHASSHTALCRAWLRLPPQECLIVDNVIGHNFLFFAFKWLVIEFTASCVLCFLKKSTKFGFCFVFNVIWNLLMSSKTFLAVPCVWTFSLIHLWFWCYFSEPSRKCAYYVFSLCFIIKLCTVMSSAINKLTAHCDEESL